MTEDQAADFILKGQAYYISGWRLVASMDPWEYRDATEQETEVLERVASTLGRRPAPMSGPA